MLPLRRTLRDKHGGKARKCFCFLPVVNLVFISGGDFFFISPTSQPLPVPHLALFTPVIPEGNVQQSRGGRGQADTKRETGGRTVNDQCKKKKKKKIEFTVRESRRTMPVIYHIKTAFSHTHTHIHTHTHTIKAEDRNCFLSHFFIQLIHFSLFYQGCDSKKAKTSSYKN